MYDLQTAKKRLGIASDDTSQDASIKVALDTGLAIAENYCDRYFLYSSQRDTFIHNTTNVIQVSRWPIQNVFRVYSAPQQRNGYPYAPSHVTNLHRLPHYHVHNRVGQLIFDGVALDHEIVVEYIGGFNPLPSDLEMALWGVFDTVWPSISGEDSSSGGGGSLQAGDIERVTIPDVGSITFASSSSTTSSSSYNPDYAAYSQYGAYFPLLDPYRAPSC